MARGVRKSPMEKLQEELGDVINTIAQYENCLETMKEKKKSMRTYAVYGNTAAAELILAEDRKRHFTVIAGGKEQNGDCGMATELTGMGVVVSALLGLLETCLIFLGLRLSFSFIPAFSVAVLWASLSILTGAFLELLLSIFGQSVYTDIRLQAEPYDRSGRRR